MKSKTYMNLKAFQNTGFDRGRSKLCEFLWLVVRFLFFEFNNLPLDGIRSRLLRVFGAEVGETCTVKPQNKVTFPWKLELGDHVWLGEEVWLLNLDRISIGSHVCISQRAFLCTGNHDWAVPAFDLKTSPIVIEDEVWIGANVFVGPGVTIGRGCVVTAGSVVTGDLPEGMICSGNPCQPVKPRPAVES